MDWIIRSGAKSSAEVNSNSGSWGYYNGVPQTGLETGSNEERKANNMYDIAGNSTEWTQEVYSNNTRVGRGRNMAWF